MKHAMLRLSVLVAALLTAQLWAGDTYDLVIAGGTLDGVRLAVREAAAGRKVYLVVPRPYLGEDRAATLILDLAFSVRLEGATEFQNLRYETMCAVRYKVGMRLLRYVFRADSDRVRLVFTDRKDDGSAAPDGFKQALNYISFMPYYVESPNEPAEIAAALGWKDANRVRNGK